MARERTFLIRETGTRLRESELRAQYAADYLREFGEMPSVARLDAAGFQSSVRLARSCDGTRLERLARADGF
jgi:hypothetical protein